MSILESAARFFGKRDRASTSSRSAFTTGSPRRSMGPRRGLYDITGGHSLVPDYPEFSPTRITNEQRYMQTIARALYLNNGWVRNLVRVLKNTYFSGAPVPMSRFPDANDLFEKASADFDSTGVRPFSGFLREDIARNKIIDGEVFVRRRSRWKTNSRGQRVPEPGLLVPLQYQVLTSEFVPMDDNMLAGDAHQIAGITINERGRPVSYKMFKEHPRSLLATVHGPNQFIEVPADEVYHVFDPMSGAPRGDVPLAAALLRAIKLSTLDDAEIRRKLTSQLVSLMIETNWDVSLDDDAKPSEDEVMQMVEDIDLVPGGIIRVPAGNKARFESPADEPQNFEKSFRFQLLQICASQGANFYEVTGDYSQIAERLVKLITLNTQREGRIIHEDTEHQLLRYMWRDHIEESQAAGVWQPPRNAKIQDLYSLDWQWPVIPSANLTQELNALVNAEEKGVLPTGFTSRNMFGLKPAEVARESAKELARRQAIGLQYGADQWQPTTELAQSIYVEAATEEFHEREMVEAAMLEDSPLINGKKSKPAKVSVPPPVLPEPKIIDN